MAQDRNEVYATELVRHGRGNSEIMKHELRTPEKKASRHKQIDQDAVSLIQKQ